jgi:hypothetical protein
MVDAKEIEKEILRVAGNPESGSIVGLAPQMAEAIIGLINPSATRGKQTRVISPPETRDVQLGE